MEFNIREIQLQTPKRLFMVKNGIKPVRELSDWFQDNNIKWSTDYHDGAFWLVIDDDDDATLFKMTWVGA